MWDRWLVYVSAAFGGARALEGGSLDGFQASSTVTFDGFDLGGDVRSSFADFIAALRENGCDRLFLHCGTGYGSSRLPTGSPPDNFALVALPGEFIWPAISGGRCITRRELWFLVVGGCDAALVGVGEVGGVGSVGGW